jgi:hypothetical protein
MESNERERNMSTTTKTPLYLVRTPAGQPVALLREVRHEDGGVWTRFGFFAGATVQELAPGDRFEWAFWMTGAQGHFATTGAFVRKTWKVVKVNRVTALVTDGTDTIKVEV